MSIENFAQRLNVVAKALVKTGLALLFLPWLLLLLVILCGIPLHFLG